MTLPVRYRAQSYTLKRPLHFAYEQTVEDHVVPWYNSTQTRNKIIAGHELIKKLTSQLSW